MTMREFISKKNTQFEKQTTQLVRSAEMYAHRQRLP